MRPANLLILLSDQHRRDAMSALGHPAVRTPTLDALAARGVRFDAAYCNSPICVPARASLATGNFVHRHRFWDNATPYDGSQPSWGHRLQAAGRRSVAIGKLHYRSERDHNGFDEEIIPYHVKEGVGDAQGLLRQDLLPMRLLRRFVLEAGPGESWVTEYDREVTRRACAWLQEQGRLPHGGDSAAPWVLLVSLICPHPPLQCPAEFFDAVDPARVPLPPDPPAAHPAVTDVRKRWLLEEPIDPETRSRAARAYYGLCAFMDDNLRQVLQALQTSGLAEDTRVIYTSDHGEGLGDHGVWGKSVLYEAVAGVPLIAAGPDIPQGQVCAAPVSHVDLFPTILEMTGTPPQPADAFLPGQSLLPLLQGDAGTERFAFSEYHAAGARQGGFLLRQGDWKLIHYEKYPPQLYNLRQDPKESINLAERPAHASQRQEMLDLLEETVIPESADTLAKGDQARRVQELGGREAVLNRGELRARSPVSGEEFAP